MADVASNLSVLFCAKTAKVGPEASGAAGLPRADWPLMSLLHRGLGAGCRTCCHPPLHLLTSFRFRTFWSASLCSNTISGAQDLQPLMSQPSLQRLGHRLQHLLSPSLLAGDQLLGAVHGPGMHTEAQELAADPWVTVARSMAGEGEAGEQWVGQG